ncbi:hypothetical protein F511_13158 [Dorcoceras hygrometricum]|uniref:Uncharacterized protein n=1 Tax=Dorcoceras hygrometricum TaxID=472368 RepID=A0A2Z7D9Z2_9LAMI|nr:hypothetical protein F511_13158 [Dorcoceras hygrometricum]
MRREVKEMKRRRAEESADGLSPAVARNQQVACTSRRKMMYQSRATVDPVEGYSALHIQSTKNSAEAQSSSRHGSAAKQLMIYES